jgi:hypothetical protein
MIKTVFLPYYPLPRHHVRDLYTRILAAHHHVHSELKPDNMLSKHVLAVLAPFQHFRCLERPRNVGHIVGCHAIDATVDVGHALHPEDQVREVVLSNGLDGPENRYLVDLFVSAELSLVLGKKEARCYAVRRSYTIHQSIPASTMRRTYPDHRAPRRIVSRSPFLANTAPHLLRMPRWRLVRLGKPSSGC